MSLEEIRRYNEECILATGIDKKLVIKAQKNIEVPEDNMLYRQYLNCLYLKQGYQNEKGEILYDNIKDFVRRYYSDEDIDRALNPCRELKREKLSADNAFVTSKCILKNLKLLESEKNSTETVTGSSTSSSTSTTVRTTTTADNTEENVTTDIYSAVDNAIVNEDNNVELNSLR